MIGFRRRMRNISSRITIVKFLWMFLVCAPVLLTSCDQSSIIGLNVQPTNDLLNVVYNDTSTLITKSVEMDSLRTDAAQLELVSTDALLGYYWDPIFGKTSASIYTQLSLSTGDPGVLVNPVVDSVILTLVYDTSAYYGKTQKAPQNINVYQLSEDLVVGTAYYSNHTLSASTPDLVVNKFAFTPNLISTDSIDGELLRPCVRIPINASFGQSIINSQSAGTLASNAAFQTFMKGFYITTENSASINNGDGNIFKINFGDYQTRLRLYYHCDTTHLRYDLNIGTTSSALFTHFKHNFTDPDLVAQVNSASIKQNDHVYIQSMAGVKVKIEMPYIMNLNNAGIHGINKTELVIKVDTTAMYQSGIFTPPANLIVYGINDDGSDFVLSDFYEAANYSYGYYIGGTYNSTACEYRINISRYIQQLLAGKIHNNGLHLLAYQGAYNAKRVVLGGGSSSAYKMKLSITCTK